MTAGGDGGGVRDVNGDADADEKEAVVADAKEEKVAADVNKTVLVVVEVVMVVAEAKEVVLLLWQRRWWW